MTTKTKQWIVFYLIMGISFLGLNLYMAWLENMIVPFDRSIDLTRSGSKHSFSMDGFYSDNYYLAFEFKVPPDIKQLDWDEQSATIKNDFNVNIDLSLKEKNKKKLIKFKGNLSTLTYSNHHVSPETDGMLHGALAFDAKLSQKYKLIINVIDGSANLSKYETRIVFEGIDDGYFGLRKQFYNICLCIPFLIIYGIILYSKPKEKRKV